MIINIPASGDPKTDLVAKILSTALRQLNLDNIRYTVIAGVTSSTGDSEKLFKHGVTLNPETSVLLPAEGRIYIPRHGFGDTYVDIRSAQNSEEFKVFIIY